MTPEEADQRSQRRARRNKVRLGVTAVFALASLLLLAGLLERQQVQLENQQKRLEMMVRANQSATLEGCLQRRANTIRVNATWDALARIDSSNTSLTPAVRRERTAAYEHAKLEIPECIS